MGKPHVKVFSFALALICSLIFISTLPRASAKSKEKPNKQEKKSAIIIKLAAGASIETIANKYGIKKIDEIPVENSYLLLPQNKQSVGQLVSSLTREPGVMSVEGNIELSTPVISLRQPQNFPGDDPIALGISTNLYRTQPITSLLQLTSLHSIAQGQGVTVAVIDSGIDMSHPALTGRVAPGGFDFVDFDTNVTDEPGGPNYGHGTFISGLVLLLAPQARILPLRAMDQSGTGTAFDVGAAIYYAVASGAKVINLSLGTDERPYIISSAIAYAQRMGCVVVSAAGNGNSGLGNVFPANLEYVIGVGATDFNDKKASFSNFGRSVDINAPGVDLVGPFPGGGYSRWSGTSFATPLVAAEAALLFSKQPRSASEVINMMLSSTLNLDAVDPAYRGQLGKGRILPLTALQR